MYLEMVYRYQGDEASVMFSNKKLELFKIVKSASFYSITFYNEIASFVERNLLHFSIKIM